MSVIEKVFAEREQRVRDAWSQLMDILHKRVDATAAHAAGVLDAIGLPNRFVAEMDDAVRLAGEIKAAGGSYDEALRDSVTAAIKLVRYEIETELLIDLVRKRRAPGAERRAADLAAAGDVAARARPIDEQARDLRSRWPFLFYDAEIFPPPIVPSVRRWYAAEAERMRPLLENGVGATETPAGMNPKFYARAVANVAAAFPAERDD